MSFLDRIFGPKTDPEKAALLPLYDQIVAKARAPHWYREGNVPDNLDGRFEMVAAILSLMLIRLEQDDGEARYGVYLTEIFVDDMDGQLREIGIGDMLVGKHIGKMMSALGGRLTAYRKGLRCKAEMRAAIARNIFTENAAESGAEIREGAPGDAALDYLAQEFFAEKDGMDAVPAEKLISGKVGW